MQGSFSLGQDVLKSLSQYLQENYIVNERAAKSRRSNSGSLPEFAKLLASFDGDAKTLKGIVYSAGFCKGLTFCDEGNKSDFVVAYVSLLGNVVDSIIGSVAFQGQSKVPGSIFIEKLQDSLHEVHKILHHANSHAKEMRHGHEWVSVLKRISGKILDQALLLVYDKLPENTKDMEKIRKKLIQKLVLAIVIVENRYENKLCSDFDYCIDDHVVTKTLHQFLQRFNESSPQKAKDFMKHFYETLPEDFYYIADEETRYEFQVILSEMSLYETVPSKEILLSVLKTVDDRIDYLETHNNRTMKGFDSQLLNTILSDMDHFYFHTKRKKNPFHPFMDSFSDWLKTGGKLGAHIRRLMKAIKKKLDSVPKELFSKLISEVRVFLELTVDSTKRL